MIATPQHNLPAILRLHHLYVRIMFTHKAYSFRRFLANNDAAGVLEHHAKQGADSGRAGADDEHRILFGNLRYAGRPKARGKHVAHKERLFVAHRIRNAVQSLVGIRHADVLGLTSVDAATQCPTTIGIGAIVHISVSAKEAFATKGFYVHRNPVAGPDGSDVRAHLLHDAYHFVPHRGSGQGTRTIQGYRAYVTNRWCRCCRVRHACHYVPIRGETDIRVFATGLNATIYRALFVGDVLATGFWAARISEITEKDTVLIIGAGPTGICTLLCVMLKHPRRIIVCEKSPERIRLVREHYPDVQVVKPEDCREIVLRSSDHGGADVVLEVAGTDDTFRLAWECARPNANAV